MHPYPSSCTRTHTLLQPLEMEKLHNRTLLLTASTRVPQTSGCVALLRHPAWHWGISPSLCPPLVPLPQLGAQASPLLGSVTSGHVCAASATIHCAFLMVTVRDLSLPPHLQSTGRLIAQGQCNVFSAQADLKCPRRSCPRKHHTADRGHPNFWPLGDRRMLSAIPKHRDGGSAGALLGGAEQGWVQPARTAKGGGW